jgi:(p)ppGpp synthase/HD superfamily hydrolase
VIVLTPPHHALIHHALADARRWCAGRVIDDRPALAHAARVAVTLGEHVAAPGPELIAAALLHDSPEFAPADIDLDTVLRQRYGDEVMRIVRALQTEHHALDTDNPVIIADDRPVLLASTADKIVALTSLTRRAKKSGDSTGFFAARPALLKLLPHFQTFRAAGAGQIPPSMTRHLGAVLATLSATARGTA